MRTIPAYDSTPLQHDADAHHEHGLRVDHDKSVPTLHVGRRIDQHGCYACLLCRLVIV
jgi:hypothetical protein